MRVKRLLSAAGVLALAALLAACASLSELPGLSGITSEPEPEPMQPVMPDFDVPRGAFFSVNASGAYLLDDTDFGRLAGSVGYVLLGEGHSVACDHVVQARALRAMAKAGVLPAVGLEMVSVDKEPVLERFSRGEIPVDKLEKALDWAKVWGFPFDAYRPVFEATAELKLPVAALNLPRDVVRALSDKGLEGLTPQQEAWMPYQLVPPPPAQLESLRAEYEMHSQFRPKDAAPDRDLERFVAVQSAWDTKMAEAAVETRNKYERPVAILAGSGHVENGWGIAYRLLGLDPVAAVLLVMPWRGDGPVDPQAGNVFFHCPETHASRLGFTLEARDKSALVVSVAPGSAAEKAGFAAGDVLVEAGGQSVDGLWTLHTAAAKAKAEGKPLTFGVLRGGQRLDLSMPLASGGPAKAE